MQRIKQYISTHKHILFLLYAPFYFAWFAALERWTDRDFTILHSPLDDVIPFVPAFIIPYYIWFAFVAFFCIYFYMKVERSETIKLYSALVFSMTVTLIIYTIWPNAISLRLTDLEPDNIFTKLVAGLWSFDTDTNVCPSLHCLNTMTIMVAYFRCGNFKGKHLLNTFMVLLALSICASTVFLKQHSIIDVYAAVAMCIACSLIIYLPNWAKIFGSRKAEADVSGNLN